MKLTKNQLKLHREAQGMISSDRKRLPSKDIEFILENWQPSAEDVTGNAAFFTPLDMAYAFAAFAAPGGCVRVVDYGAGIGTLSYAIERHSTSGDIREITCIEYNSRFYEVGKRLFPDYIWEFGNMFSKGRTNTWDIGISNPPYGLKAVNSEWMKVPGMSEAKAIELIITKCKGGGTMILPTGISEYDVKKHEWRKTKVSEAVRAHYPEWRLIPVASFSGGEFRDTTIPVEFVDISKDG